LPLGDVLDKRYRSIQCIDMDDASIPPEVQVLIAGGSLVGLSAAMFLAWRGVKVVLVEPHTGSHPHPRAIGYTQRTMELFRAAGIASQIPEAPPGFSLRRCSVESLAGRWFEATDWTPAKKEAPPPDSYSPHSGAAIAQDLIEPILRRRARELGAELRLGTELARFQQDASGVTAWLRERGGREYALRADSMIAADGNRSAVREALGIGRRGPGHLRTVRSVLFRAPLDEYLVKGISQFEIEQPELRAFLTTYNDGRWVLMFLDEKERDERECRTAIERAIGRSDIPIEIITTGRWELTALIAESFSSGRVFLAGDAAHTLPPTRGGFGANTGIADAYDLAWKLEAVLSGASAPALLETYDAERRPVAWTRLEQTFARPDYAEYGAGFAQGVTLFDDAAMEFGQLYRSAAILGAGPELVAAATPDVWAGQPGTRAPHTWIRRPSGERISTLDLFQRGWVLLIADERWTLPVATVRDELGIDVRACRLDADFFADGAEFLRAYGIDRTGASLIRPDGYIAWRAVTAPADRTATLREALARVAFARARTTAGPTAK
jgi:2-polyprenyl-6-methoxyphenol hydroxylase-like FAD-dependent oxidoreductase